MIVTFNKNVSGVDFGAFGKKTVNVDVKLENKKGEWSLYCYYLYIVGNDGKLTPIDKTVIGYEWITQVVNDCLTDVKAIDSWKHA